MSSAAFVSQDWQPPEVDSSDLRYSVTSSFLEEFVKGHTIEDLLRELVQNEYDAGGRSLTVAFRSDGLQIDGNGQTIDRGGWRRLSVMVGTGQVLGDDRDVPRKPNGIGSKNHGLRSLFLVGDRIYVRSGGLQTVLDIHEGTYAEPHPDPASAGRPGARIFVPFRPSDHGLLEAYGSARQERDLDRLAKGLAPTLLKLAQPGASRSLNSVTVTSAMFGRALFWRQRARRLRRHSVGGIEIERTIGLRDNGASPNAPRSRRIKELEYQRTVDIPADLNDLPFPTYFRSGGRVRIGASLTVKRGRIDSDASGAFYAPLGFSDSSTGCAVSINAPFQMDSDRSSVVDPDSSRWNEWLVGVASDFVLDLLTQEWLGRFGAAAYVALAPTRPSAVPAFSEHIAEGLRERACWATRARARGSRRPLLHHVSHLAPGASPELDALLPDDWRLDARVDDDRVVELALAAGANRFTVNSAIRYRCGDETGAGLATELDDDEANLYEENPAAHATLAFQERFAKAIERHRRQLTAANRSDLKTTTTTLTAAGTLAAPADPLWVVDEGVGMVAPVPAGQRLHPRLARYGTLRRLCENFDVSNWARSIALAATEGDVQEEDREALYRYLLRRPDAIGRSVWPVVRTAPIFRNHRNAWVPATSLVDRRAVGASRVEASLSFPSREMARNSLLLKKLRIRSKLTGADLLQHADVVADEPHLAESFEETLYQLRLLLKRPVIGKLRSIAFLHSTRSRLVAPEDAYVRTSRLQRCLGPDAEYAAGPRAKLHAQLGCRTEPRADDIGEYLESLRANRRRLPDAGALYTELLDALREEGDPERFADEPILLVKGDWHAPSDVLVGRRYLRVFLGAVPLIAGGRLESVYVRLGANAEPTAAQWIRLFDWFDERSQDGVRRFAPPERRALRSAYAMLAALPPGVADGARVLLDTEGHLHSKAEARARRYLIDDDPSTADAIRSAQLPIAFADVADQATRDFFRSSGVFRLTEARQEVRVALGEEQTAPTWLRARDILDRLHRRTFASAVHAVARATTPGTAASEAQIAVTLRQVTKVTVVSDMTTTYRVGGYKTAVDSDVAIDSHRIVLRIPRSKLELYRRLAQAVSAIAETVPTAQASLADSVYFLLAAESPVEQQRYLAERGIVWRPRARRREEAGPGNEEEDAREGIAETLTARLLGGKGGEPTSPEPGSDGDRGEGKPTPRQPLPPIGAVTLQEADESDWQPSERERGGGGGGGGNWQPRSAEQQEADRALGLRGEELVYREEVKRVRALGFPKSRVVWVSKSKLGANHDILSVDSNGGDLWIEVKATSGRHGHFDWPRAEFELALGARKRYVLYRVYEADTTAATFRALVDPIGAILAGKIKLDVSGLGAEMAPVSDPSS
jgi:hypothetical protein